MWRILAADDDPIARKLVEAILKSHADCTFATNGREAIEAYRASIRDGKPYDIILLDIQMPEVDGMEALRQIRDDEEHAGGVFGEGIPIIVVTAFKEHITKMFNLGCDDFIVKPVSASDLIRKIEEKINSRKGPII